MSKTGKIILYIGLAIVAVIVIAAGALMFWARPDRLSEQECRDLVQNAWDHNQTGYLTGKRLLEYRLGQRTYRIRAEFENYNQYPALMQMIEDLFPQTGPDEGFFNSLDIRHMGRTRVVGHPVEKIRLTPAEYTGGSIELWIHPDRNGLMAWRSYAYDGSFVRGYRFQSIAGFINTEDTSGLTDTPGVMPFLGECDLLTKDEIGLMASHRPVPLPEWLPPGFNLAGGRIIPNIDAPAEIQTWFPGMGSIGRMRGEGLGGGFRGGQGAGGQGLGAGHLQLIFTDRLNTISVILLPPQRMVNRAFDHSQLQRVINDKAVQVREVFHTTMVGRVFPDFVILLYGNVSPDILDQVADSIHLPPIDPELRENLPELPPGGPDGLGPSRDGRPPFIEGPGRPRGRGPGPEGPRPGGPLNPDDPD